MGGEGSGGMWAPEIVLAGQAYLIYPHSSKILSCPHSLVEDSSVTLAPCLNGGARTWRLGP